MELLYRALLHLYPQDFRTAFAAEMVEVFNERALEEKRVGVMAFARFIGTEALGLIAGVANERRPSPALAPVAGGLALAAALHSTLYAGTFKLLHLAST